MLHFGVGKVVSAATGLVVLLLTIRLASAQAFGGWVSIVAIIEIFYLVAGLGLSYYIQRYVPELRMRASKARFAHQLQRLLRWRAALALAFALPLCALAPLWGPWLNLPLTWPLVLLTGAALVFGCLTRHFDELLQSLLLQGWVQIQTVLRNCLRLAILCAAWLQWLTLDLLLLVAMEALVAAVATLGACWMQASYLRRPRAPASFDAGADADGVASSAEPTMRDARSQSLRFWLAQLLAQAYGGNAIKLVVNLLAGIHAAAIFGFAYSITGILRTYSPAFLLSGWVRPLLVSRFVQHGAAGDLKPITSLVVSVSVVGLLPFLFVALVFGPEIAELFGKHRYPEAAVLLAPMVAVVCLQAVHAVLGMVCAAVERTSFVLSATAVCAVCLPLTCVLTLAAGLPGAVAGLLLGELLWVATVLLLLRQRLRETGFTQPRRLAAAAALAAIVGLVLAAVHARWPMHAAALWLLAATLAALLYWALAWWLGVFGKDDQALIGRFLARKRGH